MASVVALLSLLIGSSNAALAHPGSGIVVDRLGRVYYIGSGSRIMRTDAKGRASVFVADDRIRIPHHLAIDAAGNVYTVSDDDGRVWKISPDGRLTLLYEPKGPDGPRIGAWGDPFTIDAQGAIYFIPQARACATCPLGSAALKDPRVFRLDANGAAPYGDTTATFDELHGSTLAWGPGGDLYVTDRTRVRRIGRDGAVSTVGGDTTELQFAMGVAVDSAGNVYVADYWASQLVRIGRDGQVERFGRRRLVRPTGVTVGPDGGVYIIDNRIWKLSGSGTFALFSCSLAIPRPLEFGLVIVGPLLLSLWLWLKRASPFKERLALLAIVSLVSYPAWHMSRRGCTDIVLRGAAYAVLATAAGVSITGLGARWRRSTAPA